MNEKDNPIINPVPGDVLLNRKAKKHPKRKVYDRDLGGSVYYYYNLKSWYSSWCSKEEWFEYAKNAKILKERQRPVPFFPPPSNKACIGQADYDEAAQHRNGADSGQP